MPLASYATELFIRDFEQWVQWQALAPDGKVVWVTRGFWSRDTAGPATEIITIHENQNESLGRQVGTAARHLCGNKPVVLAGMMKYAFVHVRVQKHAEMPLLLETETLDMPCAAAERPRGRVG